MVKVWQADILSSTFFSLTVRLSHASCGMKSLVVMYAPLCEMIVLDIDRRSQNGRKRLESGQGSKTGGSVASLGVRGDEEAPWSVERPSVVSKRWKPP